MQTRGLGIFISILSVCCIFTSTEIVSATQYEWAKNKVVGKNATTSATAKVVKATQSVNQNSPKTNHVLVRYRDTGINAKSASLNRKAGGSIVRSFRSVRGLRLIKLADGVSINKALQTYRNDPQVLYAEPDFPLELRLVPPELPNDTQFNELWGLHNTGQITSSTAAGTVDADINALEAWYITTGSPNTIVAVIDTGVDYSHVDLKDNMWVNPNEIPENGIDDDGNGYVDDIHGIDTANRDSDPMDSVGHGTHIAGTIAAKGNNGLGVTGINWEAKIIACKIFTVTKPQGINGFVSSAIECLDYLYDLKTKKGVDIVASNNSWGWGGTASLALKEAINRQAEAGILFVAAAGNGFSDNDIFSDNPSSYYIPNVIAVAATDNNDKKAVFSNYGKRSVHVGAPGVAILSTKPGSDSISQNPFNITNSVFFDDAETANNNWVAEAPWALTNTEAFSGTQSWTDSPDVDYVENTDVSLMSPVIDLSASAGSNTYLAYMTRYEIEGGFDQLFVEYTKDSGQTWFPVGSHSGFRPFWRFSYFKIPAQYQNSQFQFRFRLQSDNTVNYDGIHIDDIGVGVIPADVDLSSNLYETHSGTSMASPHVVGLLALLKAQDPSRDWRQLKNLLLSGGTPTPDLNGNTVTGRRIRAADSDGTGSLTCNNQSVQARLMPNPDKLIIKKGNPIEVSVVNILCDQPAGEIVATITDNDDRVTLLDDGSGFDHVASDGIYSAQINLPNDGLGSANITITDPNNPDEIIDSFDVLSVPPYLEAEDTEYRWRDLSDNENVMEINQDFLNFFSSPFAIHFGDAVAGFSLVGVSTSGYLVLTNTEGENKFIPSVTNSLLPATLYSQFFGLQNIFAPFWDHMLLTQGNLVWAVSGQEPNRELVVEWRDVTHFEFGGNVSFQVVFSENSSEIIFNYKDVEFGNDLHDFGGFATVGIQSSPDFAQVHSVLTPTLENASALIWRTAEQKAANNKGDNNSGGGGGGGSTSLLLLCLVGIIVVGVFARRRISALHYLNNLTVK